MTGAVLIEAQAFVANGILDPRSQTAIIAPGHYREETSPKGVPVRKGATPRQRSSRYREGLMTSVFLATMASKTSCFSRFGTLK